MSEEQPPPWAVDPWNDGSYSKCAECGAFHEVVRPGKTQPTCDCHRLCPEHRRLTEYRMPARGHVGGGIFGNVCPECHPPCDCEACSSERESAATDTSELAPGAPPL